jgi:hypothetical protein
MQADQKASGAIDCASVIVIRPTQNCQASFCLFVYFGRLYSNGPFLGVPNKMYLAVVPKYYRAFNIPSKKSSDYVDVLKEPLYGLREK